MSTEKNKFDGFALALEKRRKLREIAMLENDLAAFFRAWPIPEPATPLVWSWVYDLLCEWLRLISSGEFRKRYPELLGIIINFPFRSGKGTLILIWLVWTWVRWPPMRFLCASYSAQLSSDHSLKRRNLIFSRWFQERFDERFQIVGDRNRVDDFGNDRMGGRVKPFKNVTLGTTVETWGM